MTLTVADELIDTLQNVDNLDGLHGLLSNDCVDRLSSPAFSAWIVDILNAERRRRATSEAATDYPMTDFSQWPPAYLVQAATLTCIIVEAAAIAGDPAAMDFCFRLQQLVVGNMALAYINLLKDSE